MQIRFLLAVLALGGTLAACAASPTAPSPRAPAMEESGPDDRPPPPPADTTGRGGGSMGSGG